ncbi:hypothetical protein ACU11_05230 [Xanthomonas oryzae pv. oryzicola]|nr:hypothetical protein ACU11_05230 [Xanthomonas oryzae pv. oryzicola]OLK23811.1 hypothetical protein IXO621_05845 [Xanthomonas oryzae pv. oryzae]OLK43436.1 hypothetical protein IXO620_15515 [Xanthomonas oryzae pv. oryzae]PUE97104.1 hypothetical protein C7T79_06190 [Xanthomonas oryzae pv. oryzicola]
MSRIVRQQFADNVRLAGAGICVQVDVLIGVSNQGPDGSNLISCVICRAFNISWNTLTRFALVDVAIVALFLLMECALAIETNSVRTKGRPTCCLELIYGKGIR